MQSQIVKLFIAWICAHMLVLVWCWIFSLRALHCMQWGKISAFPGVINFAQQFLLDSCCGDLLPLAHKVGANRQDAVLTSIYVSSRDLTLKVSRVSSKHFAHWVSCKAQVSYFDKILSFFSNKWEGDPCHLQLFQFKIAPIGGSVCNQRTYNRLNKKVIDFCCGIIAIRVPILLQSHSSV